MMLYKLVRSMPREHMVNEVISLTNEGSLGKWIRDAGVEVRALRMPRGLPDPRSVIRLARELRRRQANVVQTWMYHADLVGGLAASLAGRLPTVWGIRQSNLDPVRSKRLTRFTAMVCARLSRHLPDRIVCCSDEAARVHREMGYDARKMVVIPNGFDLDAYRPDTRARATVRAELGIAPDRPVVGMLARFDPQKDHGTFIEAAAILLGRHPSAAFILAGEGVTRENAELVGWLKREGVNERFYLLGVRDDVAKILNGCDVVSLSSAFGEGFPNVIGEAMACGVPCVVTDVGDSGRLVGDTGRVVAPGDPRSLAGAWAELLEREATERQALGEAARRRIAQHFAIDAIVGQYCALYREMADRPGPKV